MLKNEVDKSHIVQETVPGSKGQGNPNPTKALGETSAQAAAPLVQHEATTDKKLADDIAKNRLRASEEAKTILASTAKSGRKIEDYEILRCLQMWGF